MHRRLSMLVVTGLVLSATALISSCARGKATRQSPVQSAAGKTTSNLWVRTKSVESAGLGTAAGAESTVTLDTGAIEVVDMDVDAITTYHRFGIECYTMYHEACATAGDTVRIGGTGAVDSAAGMARKTTLIKSTGLLTETDRMVYGPAGPTRGWQQTVTTYVPYSGPLPPAGWPTSRCSPSPADSLPDPSTSAKR